MDYQSKLTILCIVFLFWEYNKCLPSFVDRHELPIDPAKRGPFDLLALTYELCPSSRTFQKRSVTHNTPENEIWWFNRRAWVFS